MSRRRKPAAAFPVTTSAARSGRTEHVLHQAVDIASVAWILLVGRAGSGVPVVFFALAMVLGLRQPATGSSAAPRSAVARAVEGFWPSCRLEFGLVVALLYDLLPPGGQQGIVMHPTIDRRSRRVFALVGAILTTPRPGEARGRAKAGLGSAPPAGRRDSSMWHHFFSLADRRGAARGSRSNDRRCDRADDRRDAESFSCLEGHNGAGRRRGSPWRQGRDRDYAGGRDFPTFAHPSSGQSRRDP